MSLKDQNKKPLIEDVRTTKKKRRLSKLSPWLYALVASMAAGSLFVWGENKTSLFQSRLFQTIAKQFSYEVKTPPFSQDYIEAPEGPYNVRMGYRQASSFRETFQQHGFEMDSCAVGVNVFYEGLPVFPIYSEKAQAGLSLIDSQGVMLEDNVFPTRVYDSFDDIPDFIVNALLFVENRELLQIEHNRQNPAIEWDRFVRAGVEYVFEKMGAGEGGAGGSTLATQLEKVRHSRDGITYTPYDKLSQMLSASVRVYSRGDDTLEERKRIILDYMNAMPLAARPGFGEVIGLAEGLSVWFGADIEHVNALFSKNYDEMNDLERRELAATQRQVLSLIMAVQRPSAYLNREWDYLQNRIDAYLPLLVEDGILSGEMAERIIQTSTQPHTSRIENRYMHQDKSVDLLRQDLLPIFNIRSLYDLERFDTRVETTLDGVVTSQITQLLHEFSNPNSDYANRLTGYRLATRENMDEIIYSFTLYERSDDGNLLRVQTDNYDGELNLNEDSKLELGSTAKLRTLITYLQVIEDIYETVANSNVSEFNQDPLSQFVLSYISANPDSHSLDGVLEHAMEREYSANPNEVFYTGGGAHRFHNFNDRDNHLNVTVRHALHRSINLPFIRMMRDIVTYYIHQDVDDIEVLLTDRHHSERASYMAEFAKDEGRLFLWRAYNQYKDLTHDDVLALLAQETRGQVYELATLYRSVLPEASYEDMAAFVTQHCTNCNGDDLMDAYQRYEISNYSLNDRAYLSKIHPLHLWTARRLAEGSEMSWQSLIQGADDVIQESYEWLFETHNMGRQNNTIRTVLEKHAFRHIEQRWQALGFPFERMVPSYASALGVSGDQPAALAQLVGILQNDGVNVDNIKYSHIHLAENTPYECHFRYHSEPSQRVLSSTIARLAKQGIQGVVEQGTAVRARGSVTLENGEELRVGGKTGTGDNRLKTYNGSGQLISDVATNRTATFVFTIGDDFYGTIVAYVGGEEADNHSFTSSLPVQAFKEIAPYLRPLLQPSPDIQVTQQVRLNQAGPS